MKAAVFWMIVKVLLKRRYIYTYIHIFFLPVRLFNMFMILRALGILLYTYKFVIPYGQNSVANSHIF